MREHTQYRCPPGCDKPHCPICEGGLYYCTTCKAAEGSLTTECPGERVDEYAQDEVYKGKLDFKDGKWVKK